MDNNQLVAALIRAAQAFADELESSLNGTRASAAPAVRHRVSPAASAEDVQYDPGTMPAPYPADPNGDGRAEAMCLVVLFGQLYALNRRKLRGATDSERREIAQAAGYSDNRAWNRWVDDTLLRDGTGGLWLDAGGHRWLLERAADIGVALPPDLSTFVAPEV